MTRFPDRFDEALRAWVVSNLASFERRCLELAGRRAAAVAMTLVASDNGEGAFLLTRRGGRLPRHRGQWALPGGRLDPGETPEEAALRELAEEVGLYLDEDSVLGRLDDYATRSGFVMTPVVLWAGASAGLRPNPGEVAAVYRVPLATLDRPDVPFLTHIPESDRPVLSMPILDNEVFAPTAAIIYQLLEVALLGRDVRVSHYEQPVFAWR